MSLSSTDKLLKLGQFSTGLTAVQNLVANVADAAHNAIEECYDNLAEKAATGSFTITPNDWVLDNTVNGAHPFVYYADVLIAGIDSSDRIDVFFWFADYDTLNKSGICSLTETLDPLTSGANGRLRIRCIKAPTNNIRADYWLEIPKEVS